MKTGNGKIANLPAEIRDELNYRITDGDPGNELVEWLNSNPEVVRVIGERFDGTPISEQNLSEWRKRGYQKWLAFRNIVDESAATSDNSEVIAATGIDCDKLLLTLTAAYAEMIQHWIITPCEQMTYQLSVYKNLTNGVITLQRAELQKVRLEIARERLELLREKRRNKSPSSSGSSTETAAESSSPSNQSPAATESLPRMEGMHCAEAHTEARSANGIAAGAATAPSLPRAELRTPADASVIPQNIAPPKPVPAPPVSTPAPEPNSSAVPVIRRPSVPANTLHGIPIVPSRPVRPAPCMAPGYATQTPKPPAPRVIPPRPALHR